MTTANNFSLFGSVRNRQQKWQIDWGLVALSAKWS